MDDGKQNKDLEKNFSRQSITNLFDVGSVLQSFWIRCRSVFPVVTDRKFMESELRFVLYCGFLFWIIYLFSKVI